MVFKKKYSWVSIFLLISFIACGYRFGGNGKLPNNATSIHVNVFENLTGETGIENVITNDLIYEFTRSKDIDVTNSDEAEAFLTGIVKSVRTETIAQKGRNTSLSRRVFVLVDLELTDQNDRVLWSVKDVPENETYNVASEETAINPGRRVAINRLSKRLAEKIFNQLTDDF